jgi:hypothetical protein
MITPAEPAILRVEIVAHRADGSTIHVTVHRGTGCTAILGLDVKREYPVRSLGRGALVGWKPSDDVKSTVTIGTGGEVEVAEEPPPPPPPEHYVHYHTRRGNGEVFASLSCTCGWETGESSLYSARQRANQHYREFCPVSPIP